MAIIEEYVGSDEAPPSPPRKKMRGGTRKVVSGRAEIRKPAGAVRFVENVQSWAMVPYEPPVIPQGSTAADGSGSTGRKFLPKPCAVRDCPLGMRIIGGRPMRVRKAMPAEKKSFKKQKVEPIVILSDSDTEADIQVVPLQASSSAGHATKARRKPTIVSKEKKRPSKEEKRRGTSETLPRFVATAPELASSDPRTRVKFVLKQFDNFRRQFLADITSTQRADQRASAVFMKNGCRVNGSESIYGEVPGVEVGDHYYYRMELLIISLHRRSQGGIDYIPDSKSQFRDRNGRVMSVAVSVIASGGYEDDKDDGDTLIYTGQGGNNYKGDKRQGLDQELLRGNLALKNCHELGLSVRVIRGCEYKKAEMNQTPSGRIYYYDGMYDVVDCYKERGSAGFKVWKFKLVRRPEQGPLSSNMVLFRGRSLPPVLRDRGERVILDDISNGLEPNRVRVVGCEDDDRVPDNFQYITSLRFSSTLRRPSLPKPCSCEKECWRKDACSCIALNGDQPYNEDGALLRAKKLVYECGPQCGCRSDSRCINRVTQKGLRFNLEIFKTHGKGWGVRCSQFIPQGSFVCEYIGEIIHETDAEKRVLNDEYMFDLKIPDSMERRFGDVSGLVRDDRGTGSRKLDEDDDDPNCEKYTVDANRFGNLARFINHSCEPNLFVQCVLYDHHDHRFPHIMLFASEHISPYTELTYDYGYELDKIMVNGKIKVKKCYCGARSCQGRLY